MGAKDQLARWSGSFFAFSVTEAARAKVGDPRASLEARYKAKGDYVSSVEAAVARLRSQGFLLEEDAGAYLARARNSGWPPAAP